MSARKFSVQRDTLLSTLDVLSYRLIASPESQDNLGRIIYGIECLVDQLAKAMHLIQSQEEKSEYTLADCKDIAIRTAGYRWKQVYCAMLGRPDPYATKYF